LAESWIRRSTRRRRSSLAAFLAVLLSLTCLQAGTSIAVAKSAPAATPGAGSGRLARAPGPGSAAPAVPGGGETHGAPAGLPTAAARPAPPTSGLRSPGPASASPGPPPAVVESGTSNATPRPSVSPERGSAGSTTPGPGVGAAHPGRSITTLPQEAAGPSAARSVASSESDGSPAGSSPTPTSKSSPIAPAGAAGRVPPGLLRWLSAGQGGDRSSGRLPTSRPGEPSHATDVGVVDSRRSPNSPAATGGGGTFRAAGIGDAARSVATAGSPPTRSWTAAGLLTAESPPASSEHRAGALMPVMPPPAAPVAELLTAESPPASSEHRVDALMPVIPPPAPPVPGSSDELRAEASSPVHAVPAFVRSAAAGDSTHRVASVHGGPDPVVIREHHSSSGRTATGPTTNSFRGCGHRRAARNSIGIGSGTAAPALALMGLLVLIAPRLSRRMGARCSFAISSTLVLLLDHPG